MATTKSLREYANQRAASVTPEQAKLIDEFCEIVRAWDNGDIPLAEAKKLTGDGRYRNLVFTHMAVEHPDHDAVMRFLDALIDASQQVVHTKFGTFTMDELLSYGAKFDTRVDVATGEETRVVTFPEFKELNPDVTRTQEYLREQRRKRADRSDEASPYEKDWYGKHDEDDEPEEPTT